CVTGMLCGNDGDEMSAADVFELTHPLPSREWLLLEASAGTGKTYSLTALVARYVAEEGLRADELLMVTFTRAAAAEMKQEVREQLLRALNAVNASDSEKLDPWLANLRDCTADELVLRRERLETAISNIDSATISTIHGFFQQALGDLGIRSGDAKTPAPAESDAVVSQKVIRDVLVNRFAANALALDPSGAKDPTSIEGSVAKVLKSTSSNLAAELAPAPDASPAGQWSSIIQELRKAIKEERVAQGVVAFDDLIVDLVEKLDDPTLGEEIIRVLRSRYRLVLIDEFQDTDTFQWRLFSRVFDLAGVPDEFLALIVVGDPKQAIYRFRGADIDAYLKAAADGSMSKRQMTTNYRSDRPLVEALNSWLTGVTFGDEDIAYVPVTTPDSHADARLTGGGQPLQFRFLANPNKENADPVRAAISIDVADHIEKLLKDGKIAPEPGSSAEPRPVKLDDICILVRGHNDAEPLVEELRKRHIPAVRSRIGSVLESEAMEQLRLLLTAMANPADVRRVRAVQLSWFALNPVVVSPSADVTVTAQDPIEVLQTKCRVWANELEARGLVGWYQVLRLDDDVIKEISSDFEAERRLTDLEHVIELLNGQLGGRRAPVSAVLRALDELKETMNTEAEAQKRRIDTDRDVIQITTMHSSKGLEYPIVLMPFPKGITASSVSVYEDEGVRYVDSAPSIAWVDNDLDQTERKRRDKIESEGDELRLLYVAVTRAQHQLVIWWGRSPKDYALKGPLARVLFGSTEDLQQDTKVDDETAREKLTELVKRLGPNVSFDELTKWVDSRHWDAPAPEVSGVLNAEPFPEREIERDAWYRWSYSSLSKGARANNEGSARGGNDETPGGPELGEDGSPQTFEGPLLGMQAGADFGTFVHELFEVIDLSLPDVENEVRAVIETSGRAASFDADPEVLAQGLVLAIDTPLTAAAESPTLRSIGADRLNELVFHFPLADGNSPVTPSDLFELAAAHEDDQFSDYFKALAAGNRMSAMAGLMTGSIDSVIRLGDAANGTYGVIDYKTNRLHTPGNVAPISAYGYESMKHAMEHGDYPLQILVYNVALHRMLQLRLAGYDIDRHIGDTHYLFVRGMIGPDTAVIDGQRNGVFAWRPSSELIVAASKLLGGQS
ncbi:MAG: UvrD-helicase domain-containing protein, partial [Actinomycetia bacterium]|nr:UvrD-helicase domain-containing protein [Actinomycetes bacterium]